MKITQNPTTKAELINFFQGLIATTDLQLTFLDELEGTSAYNQKIKHHAKNLKAEAEHYIAVHDARISKNKAAEKEMYSYNEIFNQFVIAIRTMNPNSNDWSILLELLKAFNKGEIREAIEGEKAAKSA